MDSDTIDINQLDSPEVVSSPTMEVAVKMVQPIVDIIFNAFEDQLKTVTTNCLLSPSQTQYSPPFISSTHPVVLHAINFNVQLTTKQNSSKPNPSKILSNENDHSSGSESILAQANDHSQRRKRKLKRLAQLAIFSVSVFCSYLLM